MEKTRKKVEVDAEKKIQHTWLIAFGDAISDARELLGMTQTELAEGSGVNRTYISDIERGRRNVTVTTMKRIAVALKLTAPELVQRADEKQKSASFLRKVNRL